jgi:hypothetical protein
MKLSGPRILLQLEGFCVLVAASLVYHAGGHAWWKFLVFFLAPDLAMIGYALGARIGAATYNAAHTYAVVGALWLLGHFFGIASVSPICLIWLAHIGFDRLLGAGLKYPSGFKDTHLGRV